VLKISIDRVIPLTEARARLSELVEKTIGDQFWVLTKGGKPRVAVVDVNYLDQLVRRAWFNDLSARSQAAFDDFLRRQGLDPETISEAEAEAILRAEYPTGGEGV
jgi:prevent-host-death family protein